MATATAPAPAVVPGRALAAALTAERLRDVVVALPLLWWATYLTWGVGGREPHRLSVALLLLVPALVVLRPWSALSRVELVLCTWLGLAPFVVLATAPTGWAGADDAASYLNVVLSYAVLRAWAVDLERRLALLAVVVAAGGLQFAQGWLAWWGGQDPHRLFVGTFYWHNQTGIFFAAAALAALAAVVHVRGPLGRLAWCVAPLAVAGTRFTSSRGAMIGLGLGVAVLLALGWAHSARGRNTLRLVVALALSALTALLLTRPPFFPAHPSAVAEGELINRSFEGNGMQRLEDWRRAWEILKHWPLTGAGFHSFGSATEVATTRHDALTTAFAHNGFLQAAADGGLLLALPLWTAVLAVAAVALRHLVRVGRAGETPGVAGAVLLLVLGLHSGMDFDWAYPALMALMAPVAVLALPARATAGRRAWWPLVPVIAVVAVAVVGAWHGGMDLNTVVREAS